ncbi:MAG TPA: PaeR7I family type II restriction endonuclease, partial [Micropepsaceae bacterium]|nr:PaeR7I family type II restriction endonuclease [Micropepsaceae bacterium]
MIDVENLLSEGVRHFWRTRSAQRDRQGSKSGTKDAGERGAVTGGKHADGFVRLIAAVVQEAELPNWEVRVHTTVKKSRTLPGYFRPCK